MVFPGISSGLHTQHLKEYLEVSLFLACSINFADRRIGIQKNNERSFCNFLIHEGGALDNCSSVQFQIVDKWSQSKLVNLTLNTYESMLNWIPRLCN